MTPDFLVQFLGVAVAILTFLVALLAAGAAVLGFWGYREFKDGLKAARTDAEKAALDHVRDSIRQASTGLSPGKCA